MPHVTPLRVTDPRRVGRYRLAGRIAGMPAPGPVYLARTIDGSEVTITLLGGDWAADSAARDRFADEAAVARRVAPFCAARILDAGLDGGQAFLVSEYITGSSLLEVISAGGVLGGAELEALAIGAATGLAAIHQAGLVHGNFGPEHLVLSAAGPRVVEFGITPPYGAATPAADMLAWAQTVVFAATGSPPAGPRDMDILPPPLRQIVAACLSVNPAARPAARSVVQQMLGDDNPSAGLLAEGSRRSARASISAPPAPAITRPASPGRQRPRRTGRRRVSAPLWAAAALIVVAVAGVLIYLALTPGPQPGARGPESNGSAVSSPAVGSGTPSAAPSSLPSPVSATAVVPPALAGVWSGQARQNNPADTFSVLVTLIGNSRTGLISYSGTTFSCTGDLSIVSVAADVLTMNQGIITGQATCANGVVTLRQGSFGTLMFKFRGQAGPAARGILAKR